MALFTIDFIYPACLSQQNAETTNVFIAISEIFQRLTDPGTAIQQVVFCLLLEREGALNKAMRSTRASTHDRGI
jgi:hypothetical protein